MLAEHSSSSSTEAASNAAYLELEASLKKGESRKTVILKQSLHVLLALLLLFAAMESAVRILLTFAHPPRGPSYEFDRKLIVARYPAEANRELLLVTGTSLASTGIYSDLLGARLRKSGRNVAIRNIACSGIWPEDQLFLLKQSIATGLKPRAVICDLVPVAINADGPFTRLHSPAFQESFVGKTEANPDKFQACLNRTFYLYSYRAYLKQQLASVFERIFTPQKFFNIDIPTTPRSEASSLGWLPSVNVSDDDSIRNAFRKPARIKQIQDIPRKHGAKPVYEWVGKITDYCKSENIPVVFVWLPVHPVANEYYQKHLGLSLTECRDTFAEAVREGDAAFLDLHDLDHDPAHFTDFEHLNSAGTVATTEELARIWTASPAWREGP